MQIISDPNKIDTIQWKKFVHLHPNGNFFQLPFTYCFFDSVERYFPLIIVLSQQQKIQGVLAGIIIVESGIKSFFSRRCIVWGGPLVSENSNGLSEILLAELHNLTKNCVYTEFRNIFDLNSLNSSFMNTGFVYKPQLNYVIYTSSEEENFKKLSKSKQRQIRQSFKNGAVIEEAESEKDLRSFYLILHSLYKSKVKKPLPSFAFFLKFFSNPELGRIFLIKKDGIIYGGILCPFFNNKIIYEWYIAGIDGKIKNIYPSVLATWAAIKYGAENGFKYFDFLGAGSPNSDYGVREFKSKFGEELVENGRYFRINKPILYQFGKIGLKAINILRN